MRRRDFLAVAAVVAWPRVAPAQDRAPIIGILTSASYAEILGAEAAFVEGLKETGFVEGKTIRFEWRRARGEYGRLSALAAELVNRDVAVLVTFDAPAASAARAATKVVPIVFLTGADPVQLGLVDSLSRPGGNLTGVWVLISLMGPKRLELVRELLPSAKRIAFLVNPRNPNVRVDSPETQTAAEALGLELKVLQASTAEEIEAAFTAMAEQGVGAFMLMPDPFFIAQREQLVALAARHAVAGIYPVGEFVEAGGLMSYGSRLAHLYRLVGIHTGKILKGANPAELPVYQAATFELLINLKTAKALSLNLPASLLARADEVIE